MVETGLAYAKLNISLDIVSKMDDGYHNMKMVMQSINLCDEITVECVSGSGLKIDSGLPYLPGDERNIASKAALAYYAHTGISGFETKIKIEKRIPVCAGLGGGSADGACVLRLLDRIFQTNLGADVLEEIGRGVGSDVPFCIAGGTRLAEGRGDVLADLAPIPDCYVVICKPPFSCSTPELFGRIRCEKIRARPDTDGIVAALAAGDLNGVARRMYNVFEDVLPRGSRDVNAIKYALNDHGALGAAMTGSGPAVFGLFIDEGEARAAFAHLADRYKDTFIAETTGKIMV
ncbi:MAG: 4-(cytidine 5'-diphospho)-2-C-methyl-D-erythritol kinase [Oscillospiraceae bacterium]|nr:4-(cytidine 5'-diphospho)-2-C-methyl-D-erythritol kinase [Oscillospiraceae bacterium]